jgi:hypothetical protein
MASVAEAAASSHEVDLAEAVPPHAKLMHATAAEEERFQQAFGAAAAVAKLQAYMAWRQDMALRDDEEPASLSEHTANDAALWARAVRGAQEHARQTVTSPGTPSSSSRTSADPTTPKGRGGLRHRFKARRGTSDATDATTVEDISCRSSSASDDEEGRRPLPQIVYHRRDPDTAPLRDRQGLRLLHVLPARLDLTQGDVHLYTNALALYLDGVLDRATNERMTLLMDVRPGQGWQNPPVLELVGLIRHAAARLQDLYPHRLHGLILYPIPRAAIFIYKSIIQVFLSEAVRQAIVLIPGRGTQCDSPLPHQALCQYVGVAALAQLEAARRASFVHPTVDPGGESSR